MAIHAVSGKPGAGKSMYGVRLLIKELRESDRYVVTNLPLHLGRLNEFLQQAYPSENLLACERVIPLDESQLAGFFSVRGPDASKGVCYILDEIHLFFNAREWAKTGKDCLHYLSQHRKLGDDVVWITQAIANVDKQFRSVTQDFSTIQNGYTRSFGMFRAPGRFTRKTYASEPYGNVEPFEISHFTLDVTGICTCYDTAAGVGVHGSKADKGTRAKGIPAGFIIPAVILGLAIALIGLPKLFSGAVTKVMPGAKSETAFASQSERSIPARSVQPVSFHRMGAEVVVFLADGSFLRAQDGLEQVRENGVIVRGEFFPWVSRWDSGPVRTPDSRRKG